MKKPRSAEKHKGYYGNKPVKAGQDPQVKIATEVMQLPLKKPCAECPLRRDSLPGYLGGYTPDMYIEILHSPAMIACHSSPGFHEGEISKQRQCTGVAAYRANVGHICSVLTPDTVIMSHAHEATKFIGHDEEHYFASDDEFVAHHEKGQLDD